MVVSGKEREKREACESESLMFLFLTSPHPGPDPATSPGFYRSSASSPSIFESKLPIWKISPEIAERHRQQEAESSAARREAEEEDRAADIPSPKRVYWHESHWAAFERHKNGGFVRPMPMLRSSALETASSAHPPLSPLSLVACIATEDAKPSKPHPIDSILTTLATPATLTTSATPTPSPATLLSRQMKKHKSNVMLQDETQTKNVFNLCLASLTYWGNRNQRNKLFFPPVFLRLYG
jgi:hypothetical protein